MKIKHQTRIVCTIGPACRKPAILKRMIEAGMGIARLNFAHGDAEEHRANIRMIRSASKSSGKKVHIFADLPGPKIRVGEMKTEPVMLTKGRRTLLTTRIVKGDEKVIPVQYARFTDSIKKGCLIYLNDGFIQLKVLKVQPGEAECEVLVGGPLLSRKGLNIPNARIFIDAVTPHDLELVKMGVAEGLDAFGASFVENSSDIKTLKDFATKSGCNIRVIAKIERREAIDNFDSLLKTGDAIMVARGDLGVQVALEEVPIIQKDLIKRANRAGVPIITATQMMESMVKVSRPSRSDVTDVANAILDGTDCVMLSEETAIGDFPVETVEWMARVCSATEKSIGPKFKGGLWFR